MPTSIAGDDHQLVMFKAAIARDTARQAVRVLSREQLETLALDNLTTAIAGKLVPLNTKLQVTEEIAKYKANLRRITGRDVF